MLARLSDQAEAGHPGKSGLHLLPEGLRALEIRLAMADLAESSIDIQTYVWSPDLAGGMVGVRIWNAAERGVRVRLLIDDFLLDDADFNLAAFDSHPNIEVRIFNPFGARIEPLPIVRLRRTIELVTSLSRLNHRMHNKSFTVDDQMTVVGGRNIGNPYYGLSEDYNFVDFDLLMIGPQVDDISSAFDEYWNSEWAYPITAFRDHPEPAAVQQRLAEIISEVEQRQALIGIPAEIEIERRQLERFIERLDWAAAEIVFDDPDKIRRNDPERGTEVVAKLRELAAETESELIIVSPYFVPGSIQGTLIEDLLRAGVDVRIVTNSLASTNQPAVHSGYRRYRKEFVTAGVELYETRDRLPELVREQRVPWSTDKAGLHAKVLVFDREDVFVGTFNLDPRSVKLNTEMGLVINDTRLGAEIGEFADTLFRDTTSWRLTLDDNGRLQWRGAGAGRTAIRHSEPEASFGRRVLVFLASLLPIEGQL